MKKIAALLLALMASPAAALDGCLVGTWRADLSDMALLLGAQMNGSASAAGGRVIMRIAPDGRTTTSVENARFNVAVPGTPAMQVAVNGRSDSILTADGGAWTMTLVAYNLTGSANVLGQTMTIPFSSATGMFGGGLGAYGCTSGGLAFESAGASISPSMPRSWTRVN